MFIVVTNPYGMGNDKTTIYTDKLNKNIRNVRVYQVLDEYKEKFFLTKHGESMLPCQDYLELYLNRIDAVRGINSLNPEVSLGDLTINLNDTRNKLWISINMSKCNQSYVSELNLALGKMMESQSTQIPGLDIQLSQSISEMFPAKILPPVRYNKSKEHKKRYTQSRRKYSSRKGNSTGKLSSGRRRKQSSGRRKKSSRRRSL
jgi:hypothetical protein